MVNKLRELITSEPNWLREVRANLKDLKLPEPQFDVSIGWADSYDVLFEMHLDAEKSDGTLISKAIRSGRVLVAGPGGSAKTVLLKRTAKEAARRDIVPIYVSLNGWTAQHSARWSRLESRLSRVDFLLDELTNPKIGISELDSLAPPIQRLLLVDGLNEVESKIAQELILSVDEYAATAVSTSVIVSDRLVRRQFIRTDRWELCLVLPLSLEEVKRQIASSGKTARRDLTTDELKLLTSPYFLNAYLKSGTVADSRAQEIKVWFCSHAIHENQLDSAAEAAFNVYSGFSRTFPLADFRQIAGDVITEQLLQSNALVGIQESNASFEHHLKHDFLASYYLARHRDLWNSDSFDRVTFKASSFDSIMLALEQVQDAEADEFIRKVYDWNLYGVGYALSEGRRHGVSNDMRTVILAMFAERRWDPIQPSAQMAADTLTLLKTDDAARFLRARNLSEVFDLVSSHASNSNWFNDWRKLFTIAPESKIDNATLAMIQEEDSVRGWTTANVLKRCDLSIEQQQTLREFLRSKEPVFRWRSAHTLGAFTTEENVQAILRLLDDTNWRVKYGAVRSLLEIASKAEQGLRSEVFEGIAAKFTEISKHSAIEEEIRRAMLIPKARDPENWKERFVWLISSIQNSEPDTEREKWSRAAQKMFNLFEPTVGTGGQRAY